MISLAGARDLSRNQLPTTRTNARKVTKTTNKRTNPVSAMGRQGGEFSCTSSLSKRSNRAMDKKTSKRGDWQRAKGLFGLGAPELVVIAGVTALLFGPSKLPELGKSLGKTVKSFQSAANEFNDELKKEVGDNNNGDNENDGKVIDVEKVKDKDE